MKKLVLMFVAVAAISFASCGNKAAAPVEEETADIEAGDTLAGDTLAGDTAAVGSVAE